MNEEGNRLEPEEQHWISVSDLMASLMMIFLFIAISYMIHVVKQRDEVKFQRDQIKDIAVTYNRLRDDLHKELYDAFKDSLQSWRASVDRETLSIRFQAPEVLFETGSSRIQYRFHRILDYFFPRYIAILTSAKYKDDIVEIRIEGHTSSEWNWGTTVANAYIENMELSQDRTRSVLQYVLQRKEIAHVRDWIQRRLTANGLSSSKLVISNGLEDREGSRRVEFRVRTNAERRILKIISDESIH